MNIELIRRLAEQAGDDWDHTVEPDKEFLKKFAELIVRECADIARNHLLDKADRSFLIHKKIEQHFGVEE